MNLSLFPDLPRSQDVPLWVNLRASARSKVSALWVHPSGWSVRHCGHPTALWPYMLVPPDCRLTVVSHNGRGFTSGAIGRSIVDGILDGVVNVSTENCVDGIGCVPYTCDGKRL